MVERNNPQEINKSDDVIALHRSFTQRIIGQGNLVPSLIKKNAQEKIEGLRVLKGKIYEDLEVVHMKLDAAKRKFQHNLKTK